MHARHCPIFTIFQLSSEILNVDLDSLHRPWGYPVLGSNELVSNLFSRTLKSFLEVWARGHGLYRQDGQTTELILLSFGPDKTHQNWKISAQVSGPTFREPSNCNPISHAFCVGRMGLERIWPFHCRKKVVITLKVKITCPLGYITHVPAVLHNYGGLNNT